MGRIRRSVCAALYSSPFYLIHLGCLGVFWVGVSPIAVLCALLLYAGRMLAITGFYHRYFAHRSFRTNRCWQLLFAIWGTLAGQKGPLWWAAHHRHHHRHTDGSHDKHSPVTHGFLESHMLWFSRRENLPVLWSNIPDLAGYPELRVVDRLASALFLSLGAALYLLGEWLAHAAPGLGTSGAQMLVWGFCISTVLLYHATFCVNSICHRFGARAYAVGDNSRNNRWVAWLTLGEGWHNNHHAFPGSARQGFGSGQTDLCYQCLRLLAHLGVIHSLRLPPVNLRSPARSDHRRGSAHC